MVAMPATPAGADRDQQPLSMTWYSECVVNKRSAGGMKPILTWVLIADARSARIASNDGPGKGYSDVPDAFMEADPPAAYSDAPGEVRSSHGPGRAAMTRHDPKKTAERAFAERICVEIEWRHRQGAFERLVIVAAPHMLGELRAALPSELRAAVLAELDKDLKHVATPDLSRHLSSVLAG